MNAELNGTIFRLPLRTEEHAAASRISKRPCTLSAAEHLVREFATMLSEVALFLTHIHTVEVACNVRVGVGLGSGLKWKLG